jgi:hypothetical protein
VSLPFSFDQPAYGVSAFGLVLLKEFALTFTFALRPFARGLDPGEVLFPRRLPGVALCLRPRVVGGSASVGSVVPAVLAHDATPARWRWQLGSPPGTRGAIVSRDTLISGEPSEQTDDTVVRSPGQPMRANILWRSQMSCRNI